MSAAGGILSRIPARGRFLVAKAASLATIVLLFTGCEEPIVYQSQADREALKASIGKETPGDYFVGRRFYKVDYKMWGWIRKPGEPWKDSKLVMLNEQTKLAPDRQGGKLGADNNFEYRITGRFTGENIYEPASDSFYPEFLLTGASVISTNAPLIYPDKRWTDPAIRLIGPPQY